MLSIDYAFCEILYLCDFNKGSMQSINRTSLSDRAAYIVWDFGNPAKIQGKKHKYNVRKAPKCQASRRKKYSTLLP